MLHTRKISPRRGNGVQVKLHPLCDIAWNPRRALPKVLAHLSVFKATQKALPRTVLLKTFFPLERQSLSDAHTLQASAKTNAARRTFT